MKASVVAVAIIMVASLAGCGDPAWDQFERTHHCVYLDHDMTLTYIPYLDIDGYVKMMPQWTIESERYKCDQGIVIRRM